MKVRIKKLDERAVIPTYGTEFSAGADVYALLESDLDIPAGETVFIKTGIALEIPTGYVGLIYPRSSLSCKNDLAPANKVGVIDSDYRGEVMVALHNHSDKPQVVSAGERIAQIVFAPYMSASFTVVDELSDTVRGIGGFGSTGTK